MPVSNLETSIWTPQLLGAIFGALTGGFISCVIEVIKWRLGKREHKTSLRKGLFFEIDNHMLIDMSNEGDDEPTVVSVAFEDVFYKSNLSDISKLFHPDFIQKLSFYYNKSRLAIEFQEKCRGDKNKKDYEDLWRRTIVPLEHIRKDLLSDLKKAFGDSDPSELAFINVSEKYKKWWEMTLEKEKDEQ